MISYRRETVLQGALVLAKSGRLELGDNILWASFIHCDRRTDRQNSYR